MKMIWILSMALLITGCSTTVPVTRKFPDVPQELKKSCPTLQQTPAGAAFSDILSIVTTNYALYHECRARQDAWIEWYDAQKKVFDEVK
jgi:hypothetical protein